MELLSTIARTFLEMEFIVKPIGRQFGYLIFYHSNVKRLKDEFKELQYEREVVQHLVDDARRNGKEIEKKVQNWFIKVDEITKQIEELCDEEIHANTGCSYRSCPNIWLHHQLSKEAKKMTQEVVKIKDNRKSDIVSFSTSPRWLDLPSTSASRSNEGIKSRTSTKNQILEALVDPNIKMIGLSGLPGVGKTTLAKEVVKKAKEEKLFEKVVMVIVAQNPHIKDIQRQIADMAGMRFEEDNEIIRAGHIYERLKQEKKLLIVLDDLWERLDLSQVGICFDDEGKENNLFVDKNDKNTRCCKILLTSRNEELLSNQMKCKRTIKLGVLSNKEAWELFKENAELHDNSNKPNLLSVANEVTQQCGGLPLAIVAVARTLRNKSLAEWRDALRRLKNPLRRSITGVKEVDSSIKLSYDNLNSQELQHIFLVSAMLSHDPMIIDLLTYSMGLGLLQGIHTMEEAQDGLDTLVSKLKASSLLLDSYSNDRFTMHDVIREVALSIASKEQHALVVRHEKQFQWPEKNLLEGYTRICLYKNDISELPGELSCPRLEFFLLNSKDLDLRIPSMFFKSMQQLKVMGLSDMHFSSLPSSLSLLEKLRALCLHSCMLEDIAEVGKLKSLKVLSLAYSVIKQLPRELGQLTFLQMLSLAHCSKLEVIPSNLISSLKRLEVLNMEESFKKWNAEGSSNSNASLAELRQLPNLSSLNIQIPNVSILPKDLFLHNSLKRYRIFIGEGWEWPNEYDTSKTLRLKIQASIHSYYGVQKLLETVEDLCLDESNEIRNVLNDLDGSGFPNLKHLYIQNNHQIEYITNLTHFVDAFPNLETLNLHNLLGLKELCHGHLTAKSFQFLTEVIVSSCHLLKSLFSSSMVGILRQLVEIDIHDCNVIENIAVSNIDQEDFEQKSDANVIILHQLRYLSMNELPTLTNFYLDGNATNDKISKFSEPLFSNKVAFPKLEILELENIKIRNIWEGSTLTGKLTSNSEIIECPKMRTLCYDQLPHSSLNNLKKLVVINCEYLVKLIPLPLLKSLSSLEELDVGNCDSLEMVFDFEELNTYKETPSSALILRLKTLRLYNLPKLTSIFPASIAKGLLHLKGLYIDDCGIEVIVAEDEVPKSAPTFGFPKLTKLTLFALNNLKNFYPHIHSSEWPHLQLLQIMECDELEIFGREDSSSSELQAGESHGSFRKYPLFFNEKVIPNLEMLTLTHKHAMRIWNGQFPAYYFHKVKRLSLYWSLDNAATFLYGLLKRFANLEDLVIGDSDMKEIFSCLGPVGDDAPQLPPFTKLILSDMEYLEHIWNEHSPSSVSFGNLIDLDVSNCDGLLTLLMSSTARSLVQLTTLKIELCENIEEIITKQGDDEVEKEMVFKKLKYLHLGNLPRLKSFCSHNYTFIFPSLDEVIIKKCFKMSMFSPGIIDAPLVKGVKVKEEDQEKHWESNLNKTIQLLFIK